MRDLPADYWRLWAAGVAVAMTRAIETVAFGILVYQLTGSALLVTTVTMLRVVPMAFGSVLGAYADMLDRHLMLAATTAAMAVVSGAVAVVAWLGMLEVWHLGLASFVNGLGWLSDNPLRRMLIGEAVGGHRMSVAMALDVIAGNATRLIGSVLGGILLAWTGIVGVLLIAVAFYGLGVAGALSVQTRIAGTPDRAALLARMAQGFAAAFADRRIAGTLFLTIVFNIFAWPFSSLIPVIGKDVWGLGPQGIGLLAGLEGVGALVGAVALVRWLTPRWHAATYVGGIVIYEIGVIAFAFSPSATLGGVSVLLCGIAGAAFATTQTTLVYLAAPAAMRSRIMGVLSVCIGTGPLGFLALGWLAGKVGAQAATAMSGVAGLVIIAVTVPFWRNPKGG